MRVNGALVLDAEHPVRPGVDSISVDDQVQAAAPRLVVMLNKPRGLLTTAQDERGRDTVYRCFAGTALPWLAPVGRLDRASEGLLLFTNDPEWAARLTEPATGPDKIYHVQIGGSAPAAFLAELESGAIVDGERLAAKRARILRTGSRNVWLEIVLDEGRNRQIRRLLGALGRPVLRLVRVAIGPLPLGALPKGHWRELTEPEVASLSASAPPLNPDRSRSG